MRAKEMISNFGASYNGIEGNSVRSEIELPSWSLFSAIDLLLKSEKRVHSLDWRHVGDIEVF